MADFFAADFGPPGVAEFLFQFRQFVADDFEDVIFIGEDALEFRDIGQQRAMFVTQLFLFQVYQLAQGHAQNGVGLHAGQRVVFGRSAFFGEGGKAFGAEGLLQHGGRAGDLHQPRFGLRLIGRGTDHADDFVDIGVGQQQPFDGVLAGAGLGQQELGPPSDDRHAVPQEFFQQGFEGQLARLAVDQRQKVQGKRALQLRILVQLVQHDFRVRIPLDLDHQPHRFFEVTFVADPGNSLDAAVIDQGRDVLFDPVAGLLVGDFADHNPSSVSRQFFDVGSGPQGDRPPAGVVPPPNPAPPADDAPRGKIGSRADLQQFVNRKLGPVDQRGQPLADFAQVVGGDGGRVSHGDPVGAVDHQVGKPGGEHRRFGPPFVVGRQEIDRVQVQVVQNLSGGGRHAGLGISHGRRRQAGNGTEVPLLVDQHVPHVPFLGHADQRGVDHAFAVRMVVAAGVARDLGTFDPRGAGGEIEVVHGDQDPPLGRFQSVAHVGQSPADDDAHRVRQVAVLQLFLDRQIEHIFWGGAVAAGTLRCRLPLGFGKVGIGGQGWVLSGTGAGLRGWGPGGPVAVILSAGGERGGCSERAAVCELMNPELYRSVLAVTTRAARGRAASGGDGGGEPAAGRGGDPRGGWPVVVDPWRRGPAAAALTLAVGRRGERGRAAVADHHDQETVRRGPLETARQVGEQGGDFPPAFFKGERLDQGGGRCFLRRIGIRLGGGRQDGRVDRVVSCPLPSDLAAERVFAVDEEDHRLPHAFGEGVIVSSHQVGQALVDQQLPAFHIVTFVTRAARRDPHARHLAG